MKTLELITNDQVRLKIFDQVEEIGQYAAVSYAQRVVGQAETGSITPNDAELINACNPDNFLRCFGNLCKAHVAQQQKKETTNAVPLPQ